MIELKWDSPTFQRDARNIERLLDDWPVIKRSIMESQGKFLAVALRGNIRGQRFEGPRARLATIKRKFARDSNFPTDVWRDIGVLASNVESRWLGPEDDDAEVRVGFFQDVVGKDRVIAAAVLEHGSATKGIAARPLFRPTVAHVREELIAGAEMRLAAIAKDLNNGRYRGLRTPAPASNS